MLSLIKKLFDPRRRLGPVARAFYDALSDTSMWKQSSENTITFNRSGVVMWVFEDREFYPWRPVEMKRLFTKREQKILCRRYQKCLEGDIIARLLGLETGP